MKLYTVVVYDLRVCMKEKKLGPNLIKGDNSVTQFNSGGLVLGFGYIKCMKQEQYYLCLNKMSDCITGQLFKFSLTM